MAEKFPEPLPGMCVPRFGEVATFMRLPIERDPGKLDIALVGVPWDGGTTNRPGARHGPREIRSMSTLMRRGRPAILRAIARERPVGVVHFDAHSDTSDSYFGGEKYTHGTPFRRAVEEGLIDPRRMIQIGVRGSMYSADEKDWAESVGIRIVHIEEFFRL